MKPTEGSRSSEFWRHLFDFESKPGRYALVLRQPRVLFDNGRLILQLCSGRVTSDLSELQISEEKARAAAKFFVKFAMLRQGSDYYTLLGLKPGFEESDLKDNYRLLMRLTHPDFAGQGEEWPEDAATRINRAYDALAAESSRQAYEGTLDMRAYEQQSSRGSQHGNKRGGWMRTLALAVIGMVTSIAAFNWWYSLPASVAGTAVPLKASLPPSSVTQTPDQVVADSVRRSLAGAPIEAPVAVHAQEAATSASGGQAVSTSGGGATQHMSAQTVQTSVVPVPAGRVMNLIEQPRQVVSAGAEHKTRLDDQSSRSDSSRLAKAALSSSPSVRTEPARKETVLGEPVASVAQQSQTQTNLTVGAELAPSQGAPKLGEVQPYLSGLISSMLSGREASVVAMIDKPVQGTDGALRFMRQYAQTVRGAEEIRMGSLQLKSHVEGGYLIVEGAIHFVLLDANRTPIVRELRIRAYYGTQGGQTHLAALYPG
jgi:DnaJ domain